MSPVEYLAVKLAEHFPGIDAAVLARRSSFREAVAAAFEVAPSEVVLAEVVKLGSLTGARNPYAVLIFRLRELPAALIDCTRLSDEVDEGRRWAAVDRAAHRGETLRELVDRGELFPDEAVSAVAREFDDADLRGIAAVALQESRP